MLYYQPIALYLTCWKGLKVVTTLKGIGTDYKNPQPQEGGGHLPQPPRRVVIMPTMPERNILPTVPQNQEGMVTFTAPGVSGVLPHPH